MFGWLFKKREKSAEEIEHEQAYAEGVAAYNYGGHAESNPYPHSSSLFFAWERGFEDQIWLDKGDKGIDDYYDWNKPESYET